MSTRIKMSQIELDEKFLPRDEYKKEEIENYAECLKNDEILPPIVVFKKNEDSYILASGILRFEAHKLIEALDIEATIKEGSDHERIVESIESNAKHGLRLTNAEKRKCIIYFLKHPETKNWSNNFIGKKCGASHHLVGDVRKELFPEKNPSNVVCERNGATYNIETENIGKREKSQSGDIQQMLSAKTQDIVGVLRAFRIAHETVSLKLPHEILTEIEIFVSWYMKKNGGVQ